MAWPDKCYHSSASTSCSLDDDWRLFNRGVKHQNDLPDVPFASIRGKRNRVLKLHPNLVTLLFPSRCLGCDEELIRVASSPELSDFAQAFDRHWCRECWNRLSVELTGRCKKCGAMLTGISPYENGCWLCNDADLRFAQAVSIGNYCGLLQELVIRMKNQHDEQLAIQLGNILAYQIHAAQLIESVDLVVPVPTHWRRRIERGFHAAELAAEQIAKKCKKPYSNTALSCDRRTGKQGTLSNAARIKNVHGAFSVRPKTSVKGLTVLLIDDVLTSGATSSELARVLKRAGASKVYVGVIARGARVS